MTIAFEGCGNENGKEVFCETCINSVCIDCDYQRGNVVLRICHVNERYVRSRFVESDRKEVCEEYWMRNNDKISLRVLRRLCFNRDYGRATAAYPCPGQGAGD